MNQTTRREFLQTSAVLMTAAMVAPSFDILKQKPLLSFSTLGCPDWNFTQIVNFGAQQGYDGLELRGILRELDLTKCNEFNSASNRAATMRMMEDKKLQFVDLGSSATMHFADAAERKKNMDDGKRFIDLAQQIKCPYIRVFPNNFPKDQDRNATIDLIAKGLCELGDYAKGSNVSILMETHGDFVRTEDIEKVMQSATNEHTGLIWDVTNMWSITKEAPATVYKRLQKYIKHTHIKDAKVNNGKIDYTFLGKGDVPIFEAIDILSNAGYKGYYSFEWEKLWHPEIAAPELAIADYPKAMKEHFK